jgi:uncharacterized MAPEG superfamily protein
MSTELYWLIMTVLMTGLFWVPYILDRIIVRGLWPAISDTLPETDGQHSLWAQRMIKAHENAVENLALFAPAVLAAHALNVSTPVTHAAVVIYFLARLVHFIVYAAGIPVVRTLAFAVGWGATIAIIASVLHWI